MLRLQNKIAIITGASSGIGRASALLFAREGAKLVLAARREERLQSLVHEIESLGGKAVYLAGDVAQETYAQALVAVAKDEFGSLDIAFLNAASMGELGPAESLSEAGFEEALSVNLKGSYFGAKHAAQHMLSTGKGAIVFTSSFAGTTVGFPNMTAYAASKAGIIGMMRVMAAEWSPRGLRVNALLPGGTDTEMGRQVANTEEMRATIAQLHALKRMARPEEIAEAALYLCSDNASFVTGSAFFADGGVSITRT